MFQGFIINGVKYYPSFLHCSTYLSDWHYFMVSCDDKHYMKIEWTHSFMGRNPSVEHARFLQAVDPIFHGEKLASVEGK